MRSLGKESVPIQLAQCWFPELAFSTAKISIYFKQNIRKQFYIRQHSETLMVWNYQNADCSIKNKPIVLFVIIFCTLLLLCAARNVVEYWNRIHNDIDGRRRNHGRQLEWARPQLSENSFSSYTIPQKRVYLIPSNFCNWLAFLRWAGHCGKLTVLSQTSLLGLRRE